MKVAEEIVKVTRNYQVTIPVAIRSKVNIREGDLVKMFYDEVEGVIKITPLKKKRTTIRVGKKISVEEIEKAAEEMLNETSS